MPPQPKAGPRRGFQRGSPQHKCRKTQYYQCCVAVESTASSIRAVRARPRRSRMGCFGSGVIAGDDTGATVIGHIGPGPVDEHGEPVAEADQEPDMGEAPHEPGKKAGEAEAAEIGDGCLAADRGEVAVVAIDKGGRLAP